MLSQTLVYISKGASKNRQERDNIIEQEAWPTQEQADYIGKINPSEVTQAKLVRLLN